MKKEVIICDICGKPIDYNDPRYPHHRKFKVKMKRLHYACSPFDTDQWYKMDVHDKCFEELCRLVASAKEQREKDFDTLLENINAFAEAANKSLY